MRSVPRGPGGGAAFGDAPVPGGSRPAASRAAVCAAVSCSAVEAFAASACCRASSVATASAMPSSASPSASRDSSTARVWTSFCSRCRSSAASAAARTAYQAEWRVRWQRGCVCLLGELRHPLFGIDPVAQRLPQGGRGPGAGEVGAATGGDRLVRAAGLGRAWCGRAWRTRAVSSIAVRSRSTPRASVSLPRLRRAVSSSKAVSAVSSSAACFSAARAVATCAVTAPRPRSSQSRG